MESRIYATILLLVFGIVQAHSHPEGRNALHELPEFGDLQNSIGEPQFGYSVGSNFHGDLGEDRVGGRVRRERKLSRSERLVRLYKQDRVLTIARVIADTEAARRAFEAVLQEFYRLLDGYIARGLTVEQAVEQLEIHHPDIANRVVAPSQRLV